MFVETSALMRQAHDHLVTATEIEGDNRQEAGRAFDALQEVAELIYRRTGKPSLILAEREATAWAAQAVIRSARGAFPTSPHNSDVLRAAVAVLVSAGYCTH